MSTKSGLVDSQTFYWSGIDETGTRVKRQRIMAPTEQAALTALQRGGATPTEIKTAGRVDLNMNIGSGGVKFKWAQKAEFARRLYQMQRSGVPLAKSLATMGEEAPQPIVDMCDRLCEAVTSGIPLYEALGEYPKAFDEVFVAYIKSGEDSGQLVESLQRLSVLMAKRAAMAAKIKGVMAYPKMVGGTIIVLVFGILMFLVPTYAKIYDSFGAKLPLPTLVLVSISQNLLPITGKDSPDAWLAIPIPLLPFAINPVSVLGLVGLMIIGWKVFRKRTADNEDVGVALNKVLFKLPLFGKLVKTSALFRWSSTLAGALAAGVKQTDAVRLAADASGSAWVSSMTPGISQAIQGGMTLSSQLNLEPSLFPPNIRSMVATGEDTGDVSEMLMSVANTLDEDVDSMVEGLSAKIEVALLLVLGLVVGGLLVVLYLPILSLATTAAEGYGG